jgi:anti-sigma factor (TIGR02949 family)
MGEGCTCEHCEQVMQPYLDRTLTTEEHVEAEEHLASCSYCRKRYTFESELRVFVKKACCEEMPPELLEKLSSLRPTA